MTGAKRSITVVSRAGPSQRIARAISRKSAGQRCCSATRALRRPLEQSVVREKGERQMRMYQHTSTTRERVCPERTCLRRVLVLSEPPLA